MIFGISEDIMRNENYIKVIDGIAGAGKSSRLNAFFGGREKRFLSTNKLKKDAEDRFGTYCDTIAAGLFDTHGRRFYAAEKDVKGVIVIDEFLQSDAKIFTWCRNHVGMCNIIMCTDSMQLMAPKSEKKMMDEYKKFMSEKYVIKCDAGKTLRPVDDETREKYEELYDNVMSDKSMFSAKNHTLISDIGSYDPNTVYICHTNAIEAELYGIFGISDRYDIDIIPKGTIARRPPKDATKYPIIPQLTADRLGQAGYWQAANIATAQRYQGSEVLPGQRLIYCIGRDSVITNREYYTVVTRAKRYKDIYLCYVDAPKDTDITKYRGRPVKGYYTGEVEPETQLPTCGMTIMDVIKKSGRRKVEIGAQDMEIITSGMSMSDNIPRKDRVMCAGVEVTIKRDKITTKRTIQSLLKREGCFGYYRVADMYKDVEKLTCGLHGPSWISRGTKRDGYRYALDLKAAYPHILAYGDLPTDYGYNHNKTGMNWYVVKDGRGLCPEGRVVNDVLSGILKCEYVFSTGYKTGSKMGEYLHDMAHRSIEAKDKIKDVRYGYMEREYLEYDDRFNVYGVNHVNDHQLLMCAIKSKLFGIMADIKNVVYCDYKGGFVNVDCLYFDYDGDIKDLGDKIKETIGPYDFRIEDKGLIVYKTYEDLMTEEERKYKNKKKRASE